MKERLTDAALDLIWQNSYGTTSVDAICERAGAKKGSFYYFFKSKSELTAAALEAEWNKNKANMDALFSPTVPPLERFDRYFDYVHDRLAELQEKCGSILGCPLLSIGSEVSTQDQGRARYRRPHFGSEDKVFRVRYPGRACARVDCGAGSRSEGEGALRLLPRHARSGANSKRRRVAPRFQTGRNGCFGRETRTTLLVRKPLFFCQFYRRLVKYKPPKPKELRPHEN